MKKLVAISILLTLLTAAAFAQFRVRLNTAFDPELLRFVLPTGDGANAGNTPTKPGDSRVFAGTGIGDYRGVGMFNFLTASDLWYSGNLRLYLALNYDKGADGGLSRAADKAYGGMLEMRADNWVRRGNPQLFGGSSGRTTTARFFPAGSVITYTPTIAQNNAIVAGTAVTVRNGGAWWVDGLVELDGQVQPNEIRYVDTFTATDVLDNAGHRISTIDQATVARQWADAQVATINGTSPSGPNGSLGLFLQTGFGDLELWGKVGIFTGFVGNTADRGEFKRYHGAFDWMWDNSQFWGAGVALPGFTAQNGVPTGLTVSEVEVDNLRKYPLRSSSLDATYMSVKADLNPITVAIAGNLGDQFLSNDNTQPSTATDVGRSFANAGAALRVSGKSIADLITFDAIYKFYGTDGDTDDKFRINNENAQPDGRGIWNHTFGIFANIDVLSTLGIGLGYSGYVQSQEDQKVTANTLGSSAGNYKHIYPYYNGIDLNLEFTGVDRLTVTLNNNISFSSISNDDAANTVVHGIASGLTSSLLPIAYSNRFGDGITYGNWAVPSTMRPKEYSESYFGMYNVLGLAFGLTDALTASVNIGNKLATLNQLNNIDANREYKFNMLGDQFYTTIGAMYKMGHVGLGSGLAFRLDSNTVEANYTNNRSTSQNWGAFTFGIPVHFSVQF